MRTFRWIVSLGLFVACGDSGVVEPTTDAGTEDVVADTSAPIDTAQPDTAQVDTAQVDTAEPDSAVEDTGAPSTCEPGEGCFGE